MINEELVTSWKIHVAVCHIVPFVIHNKSSLGNYAEQCGEAIHNKLRKPGLITNVQWVMITMKKIYNLQLFILVL